MEEIALIGYGGHGKSVADCLERSGSYHIVGYTEKQKVESPYPYLGTDKVLPDLFQGGVKRLAMGIGYLGKDTLREQIFEMAKEIGFFFPVITDPSSVISGSAVIEEGTFIGKMAVINADAHIGKLCIINSKALIEHDCTVGDFTHIAVAAVLCGQVKVGKGSLIGANATILQCREVGNCSIVPAGSTFR